MSSDEQAFALAALAPPEHKRQRRKWPADAIRKHALGVRKSLVPPPMRDCPALAERALWHLYPFTKEGYPGKHKLWLGMFGARVTLSAVRKWIRGDRPLPEWAAELMADHLRARIDAMTEVERDLRAYRHEPGRRLGFRAVDPVTGRDKRSARVFEDRKKAEIEAAAAARLGPKEREV